ncbi:FF domain protein [Ancylostoma duodenale]|nr:FF domain protein [Ancylostoma duodenale]
MKPGLKYMRAREIFNKEPVWQAVHEDDRQDIFREALAYVTKRDADLNRETRKRNIKALAEILESMDQITYKTTWAQAQRLLIENPQFADDTTLQSMDKEDALIVFEEHIRQAEKEHAEIKEAEERRIKRQERKVREDFQKFLQELHKKGELTSMSLWSSLYPVISSDPRFDAMLTQDGSTPLDLFKFYVEELKEQYGQDRRVIKDILNDQKKVVQV